MSSDSRADLQLWRLVCRARDAEAFGELYRRHAGRVHAHLLQRTGAAEAEDLTAEVFATAWRTQREIHFDPDAGMLPWLLVCANNLLRNQQRSLRRARQALSRMRDSGEASSVPDIAEAVVDAAERRRHHDELRSVLSGLSESEQEIVQLCVVQGLTPTAVARVTDRPAGTVRSQLSRALAKARALYRDRINASTSVSVGEDS